MKTKLRYVGLRGDYLVISERPFIAPTQSVIKLRTISQSAAIRHYIKYNLPTALHLADDGMNEPGDLIDANPHNGYNPRKEQKLSKLLLHRMKRDDAGNILVRAI